MKRDLRKQRMRESKQRQKENKERRERERLERAAAWKKRKTEELLYLGPGVSGGLDPQEGAGAKQEKLAGHGFADLTPASLAEAMNISVGELRFLAYARRTSKTSHYKRFQLKKKTGGLRMIAAPMPRLKQTQRWILENILQHVPVHDAAHGFRQGRSIVTNAQPHVGAAVVVNVDLQDFFPSVNYRRVKGMFLNLGFAEPVSIVLALSLIHIYPDEVFFECFSQDESSYGRLGVDYNVFQNIGEFECGTTNIDYSAALYDEFQKIRTYKTTRFEIDPSGFEVQTTAEETYKEVKIDLPDSWVRGFLQVSSAMALPAVQFDLHPMDIHNLCFVLRRRKEKRGPRSLRYILKPGYPVKVVIDPWNIEIECLRSQYTGNYEGEIRVWGRQRLHILERLIPVARRFTVQLLGKGMPSFYVADLGDMSFTLGLSGWTTNDWSGAGNFDLLAPRAEVDQVTKERVFTALRKRLSLIHILAFTDEDARPRTETRYSYNYRRGTYNTTRVRWDDFGYTWAFNKIIYGNSKRYVAVRAGRGFHCAGDADKPWQHKTTEREESFGTLWEQTPQVLLHLLEESQCRQVHEFAVKVLAALPGFCRQLDLSVLQMLLGARYEATAEFGFELARQRYNATSPDIALVLAVLHCGYQLGRTTARSWVEANPTPFVADSEFVASIAFSPHVDTRQFASKLLFTPPTGQQAAAIVARCIAKMLALEPDAEDAPPSNNEIAASASVFLREKFAGEISRLGEDALADLLALSLIHIS